jgi:hypothetical protein
VVLRFETAETAGDLSGDRDPATTPAMVLRIRIAEIAVFVG